MRVVRYFHDDIRHLFSRFHDAAADDAAADADISPRRHGALARESFIFVMMADSYVDYAAATSLFISPYAQR